MRAVIITQDEPFATPVLLDELLGRRADAIVQVFIAPPTSKRESFGGLMKRWWAAFGPITFVRYGASYVMAKLLGHGPAKVARRHHVPVADAPDVNAPEFLERLTELGTEMIISVACPQIFRRRLLKLPPRGCINVHSGPLPRYRGQLPTFWVLYNRERETAVTVHYMNKDIDDGPIILQRIVPIGPRESQAGLMRRCKQVGGELLAEVLDLLERDAITPLPNPREQATYFTFPTAHEAAEFRHRGGRWL